MILGFKLTLAVTGWASVRDAGLAARPDLKRAHYRSPPHHGLVAPAVMSMEPGNDGPGFRFVSAWTEQAPMAQVGGTTRYCYAVHGLGELVDADALLASAEQSPNGEHALKNAFRRAVTRDPTGIEVVELAFLGPRGFTPTGC